MLIEIDDEIGRLLRTGKGGADLHRALVNLSEAHRLGQHWVVASPDVLKAIVNYGQLAEPYTAVYKYMLLKNYGQAGLKELKARLKVVPGVSQVSRSYSGRGVEISVTADRITPGLLMPTILLAENLVDTDIYTAIAGWWQEWNNLGGLFLRHDARGGGGSTIAAEYASELKKCDRLLLCICDADFLCPGGPKGATASAATNAQSAVCPTTWIYVIEARDIENLLPPSLFEAAVSDTPTEAAKCANLDRVVVRVGNDLHKVIDVRNGMNWFDLYSYGNSACGHYYAGVMKKLPPPHQRCGNSCQANDRKTCTCTVFEGLSDTILRKVAHHVKTRRSNKGLAKLTKVRESELSPVGELVASWLAASPKQYV